MKCREFVGVVHDLAHRGQLDPAVAAIARAHAEACPSCGCRLAEAENLAKLLRTASTESRAFGTPPQVEALLLHAFRRSRTAQENIRVQKRFGWRVALGWVAVGTTFALFAFLLLSQTPGRRPSPAVRAPAEIPATTVAPEQAKPEAQPASAASQTEFASGFVPVPYAGAFGPGDSAVIVRVQVPRVSLAELGYPVDESQGEGMIQADVVVGEDGWPRAVRVVR